MERDELLRALRTTAADQHRCFGCGYEHKCSIHGCAINRAAAELIEQLAAENEALRHPPNPPLTLEELREMGKEWVWIKLMVPLYGMGSGWHVNHPRFSDVDKFCCGYPSVVIRDLPYSEYGDTWLAYRRKPE